MLVQIHHQYIDYQAKEDRFGFVAQGEVNSKADMDALMREAREKHPLPKGACWNVCTQGAKHFLMKDPGE